MPAMPRPPLAGGAARLVMAPLLAALLLTSGAAPSEAQTPAGEVTVSFHVTLAPSWFDPSTAPPQITPFGVLYAIHDALVRPLPGQKMAPSLAESWTESPDGLVYEFKLRRGVKFHNGDALTTDDVKWSFERYQGAGARELRARVRQVEVVDPSVIRFYSKGPSAYGGYPDIDELFLQQARERDRAKREAVLHRIQQLTIDRVMFAPLMDLRGLMGVGPRVAEHTINSIPMYPWPSYEDIRLKKP